MKYCFAPRKRLEANACPRKRNWRMLNQISLLLVNQVKLVCLTIISPLNKAKHKYFKNLFLTFSILSSNQGEQKQGSVCRENKVYVTRHISLVT